MKPLAASDRSALIRTAHNLHAGSDERRAILAGLRSATDWSAPHFAEAVALIQPHVKGMVDYLNSKSNYRWKASSDGGPSASLSYGEGASVRISAEAPRQEGGGWYTFTVGVNGREDKVVVDLSTPRWQSDGGRPQRQGWGQKWSDLSTPAKLFPNVPGAKKSRMSTLRHLLAEEGLTRSAAAPSGKAQEAIMAYLSNPQVKGEVLLTDMSKDQSFRGIHFAKIMSAMEALDKKGLITHREQKGEGDFLAKKAAMWTEAEAMEAFDRWYKRDGHWVYSSREKALKTWKELGIEGLPDWSRVVKAKKATSKTSLDWEEFSKPTENQVWVPYNTIGSRMFLKTMIQIMESRVPGTWSITNDPATVAKVEAKWGRKGFPVQERGVQGRTVTQGFKNLFFGTLGGKKVAVMVAGFPLGKI